MPRRPAVRNDRIPEFITNFTATINNYSESRCKKLRKLVRKEILTYIIIGYENGDNGDGTPHLQIYGQCKRQMRGTALKKALCGTKKNAHIENRYGTHEQAKKYCQKEFFEEYGTPRKEKGETGKVNLMQNRLKALATMAISGASFREMVDFDICAVARNTRFVDRMSLFAQAPVRTDLQVELHYGKPDSGKTFEWFARYPSTYELPIKGGKLTPMWFDGYDKHKEVLIDDFSGKIQLDDLLRLIDQYRCKVPYKGGFINFCPDRICVTTNVHPDNWYNYEKRQDSKFALLRRFTKFFYHEKIGGQYISTETDINFVPLTQTNWADQLIAEEAARSHGHQQLTQSDFVEAIDDVEPTILSDEDGVVSEEEFHHPLDDHRVSKLTQIINPKPIAPFFDLVKQFSVDNFKYYKSK